MNTLPEIWFPHMNIRIEHLDPVAFSLFGISVYWYGIIIGIGVLSGLLLALREAKQTGQNPENYLDFILYALIAAIVGARAYYVLFSWDQYKDNLLKIFATREGGLAIYGGVIGAVIVAIIFARKKKMNFWQLADTCGPSLILGQAIGRWGNFVNQEAFGGYTDSLFAMRLMKDNVFGVPASVLQKAVEVDGVQYIQVHPTFLYESLWSFSVLIFLLLYKRKKKFTGEVFLLYVMGYASGRVWIEGLRVDQLWIPGTTIPISQVLAGISIIFALLFILYKRKKAEHK